MRRELLTAGPLGLNLTGSLGLRRFDEGRRTTGVAGELELHSDPRTRKGWPTSDASITRSRRPGQSALEWPRPQRRSSPDIGGTYHLSFQGQATVAHPRDGTPDLHRSESGPTTRPPTQPPPTWSVQHNANASHRAINFTNTVNPCQRDGGRGRQRQADPAGLRRQHDPGLHEHQFHRRRWQPFSVHPLPRRRWGQQLPRAARQQPASSSSGPSGRNAPCPMPARRSPQHERRRPARPGNG